MSAKGQCAKCSAENEYSKVVCDLCGARLPWAEAVQSVAKISAPVTVEPTTAERQARQMPGLGKFLFIAGIIGVLYFFFIFDTSVAVPSASFLGTTFGGGRVNNLGLMQDRQNGILVGMGITALGAFLIHASKPKAE